jgi:hypothetical protein
VSQQHGGLGEGPDGSRAPRWVWLNNLAVNGPRCRDVVQQRAGATGRCDRVPTSAGGNDVIRRPGRAALQPAVAHAVTLAGVRHAACAR